MFWRWQFLHLKWAIAPWICQSAQLNLPSWRPEDSKLPFLINSCRILHISTGILSLPHNSPSHKVLKKNASCGSQTWGKVSLRRTACAGAPHIPGALPRSVLLASASDVHHTRDFSSMPERRVKSTTAVAKLLSISLARPAPQKDAQSSDRQGM